MSELVLSVVVGSRAYGLARLAELAWSCVTNRHAHHYRGFAHTQWRLFERTGELKPLLYTFRALLTGVHLMRTGQVLAHLPSLMDEQDGPNYLPALIEAKAVGEHRGLAGVAARPSQERLTQDLTRWHEELTKAQETSDLPDRPSAPEAVHKFVVNMRLTHL